MASLEFINDVVKPWDDLNDLLTHRYALEPGLSEITRMATSLAVSINHFGEPAGITAKMAAKESLDMSMIRDIADSSKHGVLTVPSRQNEVFVRACFEVRDDGYFSFVRNSVLIDHATAGEFDFMAAALASIWFWIGRLGLAVGDWSGEIKEADQEFYPSAWLEFEPKYCIKMGQTKTRMLKREGGALTPFDPRIEIVEIYRDGVLGARSVIRDGFVIPESGPPQPIPGLIERLRRTTKRTDPKEPGQI